jgi:glycosyltransferase involved in cell wall biosynthesis
MPDRRTIWVVVPALNEEEALGLVLDALPPWPELRVVVADNGSEDRTADIARARGAIVVREERRGYGQACLAALTRIEREGAAPDDAVVFLDADFSDDPGELDRVVAPVLHGTADLVIGSRLLGSREEGALLPQARWGNWLAGHLIRWMTGVRFTDLGPFRAIAWAKLQSLHMRDRAFGWTVEMQLKAASAGLRCVEVPVSYRRRVGRSKITGTVRGTVLASLTILGILGRWALPGHGGLR